MRKNIPLLGICRGAQAINIFLKGKIVKIDNHVKKKHDVNLFLSKEFKIKTNSYHEYGIKKKILGRNLKILAQTNDQSIELFQHNKKKIMGMMWHPERYNKFREFDLRIIKNFFKCS